MALAKRRRSYCRRPISPMKIFSVPSNVPNVVVFRAQSAPQTATMVTDQRCIIMPNDNQYGHSTAVIDSPVTRIVRSRGRMRRRSLMCTLPTTRRSTNPLSSTRASLPGDTRKVPRYYDALSTSGVSERQPIQDCYHHNYRPFHCGGRRLQHRMKWEVLSLTFVVILSLNAHMAHAQACQFYPLGENRRFERVSENIGVGEEVFRVEVHPRSQLRLDAVDNSLSDINFFEVSDVDDKSVSIKVSKSLEDLVDRPDPQSVLKFKLTCKGSSGSEEAFLPVTVYVQDVNDHAPEFQNTPYHLEVDELTPVGLTIFRGIHAIDRDKPNTPNSDITYSIVGGNDNASFALSDPLEGVVVINKPLDYDHGTRVYKLQIQARDHGSPESFQTNTELTIRVKDADDQNPVFTKPVYHANITESAQFTGGRLRNRVKTDAQVHAFDQDLGINTPLRYSIIHGNELGIFELHEQTAELFMVREVDLEALPSPTITLQLQATQMDNSLRYAIARVEIQVQDVNDNVPQFDYDMYNITVMENLPTGFTVVQVNAVDKDYGENSAFVYHLVDESGGFAIDAQSGAISVRDPSALDREKTDRISMKVLALERKPNVLADAKASATEVIVYLLDANDNNPKFVPEGVYTFRVTETDPAGTVIGSLVAVDPDLGDNGRVVFFKQNDTLSLGVPFDVHPINGSVFVLNTFTQIAVKQDRYTFFVIASDSVKNPHERRTAVAVVHIDVTDVNNNVPEFVDAPYEARVGESLPAGALVTQLKARDLDANSVLEYSIIAGNDDDLFRVDSRTGAITTKQVLDFERKQAYDLLVQVSDGFNTAVAPLTVSVVDINDQQPVFTHNYYNFSVVEELPENTTVGAIKAIDRDSGQNAEIHYVILGDQANESFMIDEDGNIFTRRRLDRESQAKSEFLVIAFDGGVPQLSGTTTVAVTVEDVNDNPPAFEGDTFFVNVQEEIDPPKEVYKLEAKDADLGDNAVMKYRIIGGNDEKNFEINEDTGVVYTTKRLNFEAFAEYSLQVAAFNIKPFQGPQAATLGNPVVTLVVKVQDVNDEAAIFEQQHYQFRILENTTRSETVGYIRAVNPSRASNDQQITYWIGDGNDAGKFWINPDTGELVLMDKVDRDPPASQAQFILQVFARDQLSISNLNISVPVVIDVIDINDNAPSFGEDRFALELPESLPSGTELPAFYEAFDLDAGDNGRLVAFMINGSEDKFAVNNQTGSLVLISELDYETQISHEFIVMAIDGGSPPRTGSATIVISVQNINEYTPQFEGLPYTFQVAENAAQGTSVGVIRASDRDGDRVSFTLAEGDTDFFGIEKDSGRVFVKKQLESRTAFHFVAVATDDGVPANRSLGVKVTVHVREVNNHPPVFSHQFYEGSVLEKLASDRVVIRLHATDLDLQNNTISYDITSGNEDQVFTIDHTTGEIRANPANVHLLDYDRKQQYIMLVQAKDSHVTPLIGLSMVTINVIDANDHPPVFSKTAYSASLPENLPAGHCFLHITARSGDSVDTLMYKILNKDIPFTINSKTGDVCTAKVLDRELKENYEFAVSAEDGKFDAKVPISVEITDENDNPPRFEKERYVVTIPTDSQAGRSVIQLHAVDLDTANNGEITYWIKNTHGIFEIDPKTGLVRLASALTNARKVPTGGNGNATFEMEVFAQDHGATSNIGRTMLYVRISNTLNHPPVFERFAYSVFVDENAANVPLVQVHASDPDSGRAGSVLYRIVRSSMKGAFKIDETSGKITLVQALDYEKTKHLEIFVEARDDAKEPQYATTVVQVTVNDVNDNAPEFLSLPRVLRVPVSTGQNELVYRVQAHDLDSAASGNNDIRFELNPPSLRFLIHPKTGQIFATQPLVVGAEILRIVATDSSTYPLSNHVQMRVEVFTESIDNPSPAFSSAQYSIDAPSVLEAGASVLDARATIPDGSPVWYNITGDDGSHVRKFSINHDTGRIVTTSRLDAEKQSLYHFMVIATNRRNSAEVTEAGVVIRLADKNVRCPRFPFSEYFASVQENSPPDSQLLANLHAEDAEKFDKISYQITEDNSADNFYLDTSSLNTVSLRVKKPVDRDAMPTFLQGVFTLTVAAANSRCAGNTRVRIHIDDVNDNSPVFDQAEYHVELDENTPPGHVVVHVSATDRDGLDAGKLRYYVMEGDPEEEFTLDEHSGILSVKTIPDRERTPNYSLKIVAIDSANNTGRATIHIKILDTNDWTPTFLNDTFFLNVTEGRPSLNQFVQLPVADYDDGINRQVELYIVDGNNENQFRLGVNEHGALLKIVSELDRDKYKVDDTALHFVIVAARDMGTPSRTGTTTVAVVIHDVNDSPPTFEREAYYQFISESAPIGTVVETVKATDPDTVANTKMRYRFAGNDPMLPFEVDPITGAINISRPLDISESQEYTLILVASDGKWEARASLKIYVHEAEERDPRFNQNTYKFSVLENVAGAVVGQVELASKKTRANSQQRYSIVNTDVRSLFNITKEGEIYTKTGLDREKRAKYTFTVMLEERRPTTKVTVSEVSVDVVDVNDEIPTFSQNYQGSIRENSPPGTTVTIKPAIHAVDNDAGNNSLVSYSLSGPGAELFSVLDNGAVIFTGGSPENIATLDRELTERYELLVTARDRGNLSSSTYLTIRVEDENDNAPVFQHGPLKVLLPETARPGARVAQVQAIDIDERGTANSKVDYSVTAGGSGNIRIDRQSGELFVVGSLKPESVYNLNITASDGKGLANVIQVNITVLDVNDHQPTFVKSEYNFRIEEGNYRETKRRLGVLRAVDEDKGQNGAVDYALLVAKDEEQLPFTIDVHTGELWATGVLDREAKASYSFQVLALDNGEVPRNSTVDVTVGVDDVNDERPKFFTDPYLAQVPENLDPGQKVTQIRAFDPDAGENGLVFYKLGGGHGNKFYIDSKDGTVWTLSKLDFEQQEFYNMTVIAYDQGTPSLSSTAKLWVTVTDRNDVVPDFAKSVYTLEVAENTKVGDVIFTLDAGSGNFHYSLVSPDEDQTFTVEPNTGEIRLAKPLDSAQHSHYKLVVKADDEAEPGQSRSDTAEVNVIVGSGQGVRLFPLRLYDVLVFENQLAPQVILDLNATDEIAHRPVEYRIVGTNGDYNGLFSIESDTGRLSVTSSLDREAKARYLVKVKVSNGGGKRVGGRQETSGKTKESRGRRSLSLGSHGRGSVVTDRKDEPGNGGDFDVMQHIAFDETVVSIKVGDENDNSPVFEHGGKPIVAAVPLEASFGYQVARVRARDADTGSNGAIRYEIVPRSEDASSKFQVDPLSGIIRSVVTFSLDGGKLYTFDVRATDRGGAEGGNSALISLLVHVLPETKLVLFVADTPPVLVEEHLDRILGYLSNVTHNFDVKMAKLEPHHEDDAEHPDSSDLFLYAIDKSTNEIVDTETLLNAFNENSAVIVRYLDSFRIRRIQGVSVQEKISQMGTTEIAIIALSSVIFLGAVLGIVLLCSSCQRKKLRKRQKSWEQQRLYSIKNPMIGAVGSMGAMSTAPKMMVNPGYRSGSRLAAHSIASSRPPSHMHFHGSQGQHPHDDAPMDYDEQSIAGTVYSTNRGLPGRGLMSKRNFAPDGASTLNRPRSPRYEPSVRGGYAGSQVGASSRHGHDDGWLDEEDDK
ncbi:protocadherin Fat 4-like isoform X3 [Varroa jacobsoni]|nr:protocadherin Fat 4-like isoform X3 [Varroa jacobsoni]XP_022692573.1 protocadherin Fat 4-like isoform X3 [Varroa jacobsoni]